MKCLDCKKRRRGSKNAECWNYQKCGRCFHHGSQEYPKLQNTRDFRFNTWPTDMFLDKGMDHAIRELEKNEN